MPDAGPHDEAGYSFASHVLSPFDRPGRPLRAHIVVHPSVEFKAIEADPLLADRDFGQVRAHLRVEAVAVHAEVGGASRKRMIRGSTVPRRWFVMPSRRRQIGSSRLEIAPAFA